LRYEKGLSIKGIAKIIHKTPNAVKLALSRYRRKIISEPSVTVVKDDFECKHHAPRRQLRFWKFS